MKDRQNQRGKGIPLIGILLHYISMSAIVLLRRNLGFRFLQPYWLFLLSVYVLGFYMAYAWLSRDNNAIWQFRWPFLVYLAVAALAYIAHLIGESLRQANRVAEHDHYSGRSRLLPLVMPFAPHDVKRQEYLTHVFLEPGLLLALGITAKIMLPSMLGSWLILTAVALVLKELLNHWYHIRKIKEQDDKIGDAEDQMTDSLFANESLTPQPTKPKSRSTSTGRVPRQQVPRRHRSSSSEEDEKFAAILEMDPPYTLEKARSQYHTLSKRYHIDTAENADEAVLEENEERLFQIQDAYTHFKRRFAAKNAPNV